MTTHKTLSPTEARVLKLVAEGNANKAIGKELNTTEATVKVHLKKLFRIFEVKSRTALAAKYWKNEHAEEDSTLSAKAKLLGFTAVLPALQCRLKINAAQFLSWHDVTDIEITIGKDGSVTGTVKTGGSP